MTDTFQITHNREFLQLSDEEQAALHKEIAEGLNYAIAHHDTYACYLKGMLLYFGNLGYPEDPSAALEPLERGCQMAYMVGSGRL